MNGLSSIFHNDSAEALWLKSSLPESRKGKSRWYGAAAQSFNPHQVAFQNVNAVQGNLLVSAPAEFHRARAIIRSSSERCRIQQTVLLQIYNRHLHSQWADVRQVQPPPQNGVKLPFALYLFS